MSSKELLKNLVVAYDAAGNIPHGRMDHETQWLPFANLYNAAMCLVDEFEARPRENTAVKHARRVVADYRRDVLHNRKTVPGKLAEQVEKLATIIEESETK